jgi:hypothetical protein
VTGLPVVSGAQLIRALERLGWEAVRQRGSHVRLRHRQPEREGALMYVRLLRWPLVAAIAAMLTLALAVLGAGSHRGVARAAAPARFAARI